MKTPREILFERHESAEPKLNALRRQALASLPVPAASARPIVSGKGHRVVDLVLSIWRELIWPDRRAWASLAVVWLGVLAANLEMKAGSPKALPTTPVPAGTVAQAFEERRRLLAELLPPNPPRPPVRAQRHQPGPRSERPAFYRAG